MMIIVKKDEQTNNSQQTLHMKLMIEQYESSIINGFKLNFNGW